MKKGRMEFSGTGGKFCTNVNVKLFCYINSKCAFSKTIKKKRCSIESDGTDKKGPLKIQRIFIENPGNSNWRQMAMLNYFAYFAT